MKSAIWMSGALFSFSLMAIAVKELGQGFSLFEMLFFRSVIGLLILTAIIYSLERNKPSEKKSAFNTHQLKKHIFRNAMHFGGQWCWMFGILYLPLAQVFALEFTTPMWTLLIACLFFGERLNWQKTLAVFCGLIGVVLITQPSSELFNPVSVIVLMCGIFYGISLNVTKTMVVSESPLTILFYMSLVQLPIGFIGMLSDFIVPSAMQAVWVISIALTALVAHFCISKAMMFGEVSKVMTIDFVRLPVIIVVGALIYNESLDGWLLLGGIIIFIGNAINLGAFKSVTMNWLSIRITK
jgi:drug/metabolite transporter (DMT)-like permease